MLAGWWNGCSNCGAYQDQINDIEDVIEACEFALEHLEWSSSDGFLCDECYEELAEDE